MKVKILAIAIVIALFGERNVLAQHVERVTEYTFIRHDSIPMLFADSVATWSGHNISTEGLTADDPLYYRIALTPSYPLVKIHTDSRGVPIEERAGIRCFALTKGMIQRCVTYKTIINGDTVVIDSHEKFREIFAPVENMQEAIAFAYFFTDSKPMYNLEFLESSVTPQYHYFEIEEIRPKNEKTPSEATFTRDSIRIVQPMDEGWDVFQPAIISSYVKETPDGYELLLYHYEVFGGSHPFIRRLIQVGFDGHVEIMEECAAFAKRRDYGMEVD